MEPWGKITDRELREYLDDTMFFMVELGGLDMHAAWEKLNGVWPADMSPGLRRDIFFNKAADDLGFDLARGKFWWNNSIYKDGGPKERYAKLYAAVADGSWERKKQTAFP